MKIRRRSRTRLGVLVVAEQGWGERDLEYGLASISTVGYRAFLKKGCATRRLIGAKRVWQTLGKPVGASASSHPQAALAGTIQTKEQP